MKYHTKLDPRTGDVGILDESNNLVAEFYSAVTRHDEREDQAAQSRADAFCGIVEVEDVWAEDPEHPSAQWQYEVENDDTRRGYWDWVAAQKEMADAE